MKITIPMKLPSLANTRLHWRAMAKIKQDQKLMAALYLPVRMPPLPATVTITRIGKRKLDSDNLQSAGKYLRDQIAAAFGVDDGSDLYEWVYKQRIGKEYGVEVEIEPKAAAGGD